MSYSKRLQENKEEYEKVARSILLKIGVLDRCETHGGYFNKLGSYEELDKATFKNIFQNATEILKQNHEDMKDYNLFQEQIKQILTDTVYGDASDCQLCSK